MKRSAWFVLAILLIAPDAADAQRRSWRYNSFSFSPYAGALFDAYDLEADDSNVGWLVGFRAGYQESPRFNLHLNTGYSKGNDIGTRAVASDPIFDNQWILLTAGADFTLVPGNASVAIGADGGVGWLRTKSRDPAPGDDNSWTAYETVVPSLTIRYHFTPRAGIFFSAQDHIFDVFEGSVQHSPALTVGLSLR